MVVRGRCEPTKLVVRPGNTQAEVVRCPGHLRRQYHRGRHWENPHIEYLIRLLSKQYRVAVLSRGYKRKSRGFRVVETDSRVQDVGDEPLQIKRKFPDTMVFVDANRVRAIERILNAGSASRPDVILLDDGFQHRRVKPSLSILLVDSNRPVFEDELLPAGFYVSRLGRTGPPSCW